MLRMNSVKEVFYMNIKKNHISVTLAFYVAIKAIIYGADPIDAFDTAFQARQSANALFSIGITLEDLEAGQ